MLLKTQWKIKINQKLKKSESQNKYLMEMAPTGSLQKLFVAPHGYSEGVNHFVAILFGSVQNNHIFFP